MDRQQPNEDSELFFAELRAAVVHLTSEIFNNDGLSVIALATVRGSMPLVEELLGTANVYRFRERDQIVYDVTYLTPRTTPTDPNNRRKISASTGIGKSCDFPILNTDFKTVVGRLEITSSQQESLTIDELTDKLSV